MKMGTSVPSTVMSLTRTLVTFAPSTLSMAMAEMPFRLPFTTFLLLLVFTVQWRKVMLSKSPSVSVPIFSALQWLLTVQFSTTMFWQGSRMVFFSTMASSSASTVHPLILTFLHPLMSMPSLQILQWSHTLMSLMTRFSQAW